MIRVVSAQGAQAVDHDAIKVRGISGISLMHKAGKAVADAAFDLCKTRKIDHVQIFCGKGNNGGDGYVAAIELKDMGLKHIDVFCFADENDIGGDAGHFYTEMRSSGIDAIFVYNHEDLNDLVKSDSCWIDAIFGTGLNRPVEGYLKDVLGALIDLHDGQPVIAVDIPSGISGSSGRLLGPALKADITLSMGFYKSGNFLQDAKSYSGKVQLVELDYPEESYAKAEPVMFLCDHDFVKHHLLPVSLTGHKYTAGQVLCVGGSAAMPGAVTLASLAVLRSGAGMLRALIPGKIKDLFLQKLIEGIVTVSAHPDYLTIDDLPAILQLTEKSKAMVIGPGLGRDAATGKLVHAVIEKCMLPMVLDADALYFLESESLKSHQAELIITPHLGEFSRLTGLDTDEIKNDPVRHALSLATKTDTIVHLKGSTSLTALPSGRVFLHATGAPGMATAGSGDLLAGLIASFIAQGHTPENAILIAAYYHGMAGQAAAEQLGNRSMIASDILENIPKVLKLDEVLV
jgi:NAD(P)H-hydrate epimerase